MKFSKVHSALLIATFLIGGVVFSSVLQPVSAQNIQPTVTPTQQPIVPPDNQTSIDALETRIKNLEEKVIPFSIVMTVLGLLGLTSPLVARNWFIKKQKEALNEAFYKADPRNFPIYIPKRNFDLEKQRLEKLGFKKMRGYEFFSEIGSRGIIVYGVSGTGFQDEVTKKQAVEEIKEIKEYIEEHKNDPYAYVIYIKGQLKEAGELVNDYDNVATANMPVTIAGHLYTLARGLMD